MKTSTNDYLFFGTNPSVLSFFASHTSFFFMGDSKSSSLLLAKCLNCSLLNSFCCQARLTSSLRLGSAVVFSGEESVELLDTDNTDGRPEVTGPILILNLRLLMLSRHLQRYLITVIEIFDKIVNKMIKLLLRYSIVVLS